MNQALGFLSTPVWERANWKPSLTGDKSQSTRIVVPCLSPFCCVAQGCNKVGAHKSFWAVLFISVPRDDTPNSGQRYTFVLIPT